MKIKRHPLYGIWIGIKKRCYNKNCISYKNYGGRGITVCSLWLNDFNRFCADMGERPSADYSIERKDNNKGYSPENCHWATKKDQARNQRSNINITINGETKVLSEWCEHFKISLQTAARRITKLGWSPIKAVTTPSRKTNKFYYQGKMMSLKKIASKLGINPRTLESRIYQYGWSLEKSINTPIENPAKNRFPKYKYNGKMLTLTDIAKETEINYATLHKRIKRYGWSLEKAVSEPIRTKKAA